MRKQSKSYVVARSKRVKVADHFSPITVINPYTDVDYGYFEDAWAKTLAGSVIDKKVEFIIGGGPKPTLQLLNERQVTKGLEGGEKEKKIQDELSPYQDITDKLVDFDNLPNIRFKQNLTDATRMAKVFGRSVIAFEPYDYTENENGLDITTGEGSLKVIHSRDLGRVDIDDSTWALEGVYTFITRGLIEAKDMIYIPNMPNNPMRKNLWYGFSDISRVVGMARALQRILEFDAPEVAQSMWADHLLLMVDPMGKSKTETESMLTDLTVKMMPGAINVVSAKQGQITPLNLNMNPHVAELVQLVDRYERSIIGPSGLPGAMLGREEESTMATLFGKIRMMEAGPIKSEREWLGDIVTNQWYRRNMMKIAPEALNVVNIKTEFEPVIIESWADVVQSLAILKQTVPDLPDKAVLQIAGLEEYIDDVEQNRQSKQEQRQQEMQTKQEEVSSLTKLSDFIARRKK